MASDTGWTEGPTLSAWIYSSTRGAAAGVVRLHRLSQRRAVTVVDAATVTWVRGAHRPRIGHPHLGTMPDAGRRSPLGLLLGDLLPPEGRMDDVPALVDDLGEEGRSEEFVRSLREGLVPDSSALLVLSLTADLDEVQLVIERGRARGDVRLAHLPLTIDGLADLYALARSPGRPDRQ